jgi:uncharacterized membrane protein
MSKKKQSKKQNQEGKYAAEKRAAKKAAVLGTEKKSLMSKIAVIAVMVLAIAAGAFFIIGEGQEDSVVVASTPSRSAGTQVTHPANIFDDGKARHFEYAADDGLVIKYFVLKSSDGVIRAAFDACDVCWRAGKGYYQSGDYMICDNCKRQFASVLVNVVQGGCNPAPLDRRIEGDDVVIEVKDILAGRQYFDFSGGA